MIRFLLTSIALSTMIYQLCAQPRSLVFDHLTAAQGLSHGTVLCMMQDREGYLWFGTKYGLNRYDGYRFQVYTHETTSANSLSDNHIWSVCEDRTGALWMGTNQGLNKYDKRTNTFARFNLNNLPHIRSGIVRHILEDHLGVLWLATPNGLVKFDQATHASVLYEHDSLQDPWKHNAIHTVYEDRKGMLWVGTNKGLSCFDRSTGQFTRFAFDGHPTIGLPYPNAVKAICEDRAGMLWVGTTGNGLHRLDCRTGLVKSFRHDSTNARSIGDNDILSLCEDGFGTLWIATGSKGLDRWDRGTGGFEHYLADPSNVQAISGNSLLYLYQDRYQELWIGTYAAGINKVDLLRKHFTHFKYRPISRSGLLDNNVYALGTGHSGCVWVGTSNGLSKLERRGGTFTHFPYNQDSQQHSSSGAANVLYQDRQGNVWLGLAGGGLKKLDTLSRTFTHYTHNPADSTSLPNDAIRCILEDNSGTLWIGTQNGLCRLDRKTNTFVTYKPSPFRRYHIKGLLEEKPGILWLAADGEGLWRFDSHQGSFVQYDLPRIQSPPAKTEVKAICLHQDRAGQLWLSTEAGQLYRFNPQTTAFTQVIQPKELMATVVNGILEDNQGNLWLSTLNQGIVKFNPATQALRRYEVTDGLQGNEFTRAFCKSLTGELYFGGNNGLTAFQPDSIRDNPHAPPVVIRSFKVFDKPRSFDRDPLTLPYSDNFFSFTFAALHYALPERNSYAYRLEGVDEAWIQAGTRHEASYTNLDPGKYVLRVKAANYDGVWNERGTSLRIVITPPWWRTGWAYLVYGSMSLGMLYTLRRYTINQERMKNRLVLKSLEAEKHQALHQMQSRFFTNISHEFRTPLTLIMNPLENLLAGKADERQSRAYYPVMHRNAKRLLGLVNQLLDLSKLEAGRMLLEPTPGDMAQFVKASVSSFASLAESHQLRLHFQATPVAIPAHFDAGKLERVLYNLLSNAVKFTPQYGEVSVSVSLKTKAGKPAGSQWIEIQVKDNGIGIPFEQLERIFDRFYQVDTSLTRQFKGTGIGLALTKELVELHGGTIHATSTPEAGTCFSVELPWREADQAIPPVLPPARAVFTDTSQQQLDGMPRPDQELPGEQSPLLLLVEDNADIRLYLRQAFQASYRIQEASDGTSGLAMATETIPDLVISDWMMPGMDGKTLCAKLKTDERTSHIPVILLTAKATLDNKLDGLETGADDYLTKPFHTPELLVRVKNLLRQRQLLRERFSQDFILPVRHPHPSAETPVALPAADRPRLAPSELDEKFLQTLTRVMQTHLANPDLDISFFEREMGLSRTQLYRKIKALTDQTPVDFIRHFRLREAAVLLAQGQANVSEVAYQVGFTHMSYFSKAFRQVYGLAPSEYLAQQPVDSPTKEP